MSTRPEDEPGKRPRTPRGDERRFTPTSGTAMGWIGLGGAVVVLLVSLANASDVVAIRYAFGSALFGLVVWCYLLRPRLVIRTVEVELRNAFSSWHVPLAAVRRIAVRAITRVYTDERHFDGVAVGRPIRSMRGGRRTPPSSIGFPGLSRPLPAEPSAPEVKGSLDADGVADLVVEQVLDGADRARSDGHPPSAPARRTWALPELVALALLLVGLVVSLLR